MRGAYEAACTGRGDWKAGNRYNRNRSEAGPLYTYRRPTSARVGGNQIPVEDPGSLYFRYLEFHFWYIAVGKYKDPLAIREYCALPI